MEHIEETTEPIEVVTGDFFLRFANEDEAMAVLFTEGQSNYRNIDIIGTIYKPTDSMIVLEDGTEAPEMAPLEGFHVNVRLEAGEDYFELEPFRVFPENPVRVWA
jgi:hypothetical protein